MAKYSADRVRNVSTVWLGATMGCAECHDHKFDPFTTREFYSLAAFFADVKETAVGVQEPTRFPSPPRPKRCERSSKRSPALKAIEETRRNGEAEAGRARNTAESARRTDPDIPGHHVDRPAARSAYCRAATGWTKRVRW